MKKGKVPLKRRFLVFFSCFFIGKGYHKPPIRGFRCLFWWRMCKKKDGRWWFVICFVGVFDVVESRVLLYVFVVGLSGFAGNIFVFFVDVYIVVV